MRISAGVDFPSNRGIARFSLTGHMIPRRCCSGNVPDRRGLAVGCRYRYHVDTDIGSTHSVCKDLPRSVISVLKAIALIAHRSASPPCGPAGRAPAASLGGSRCDLTQDRRYPLVNADRCGLSAGTALDALGLRLSILRLFAVAFSGSTIFPIAGPISISASLLCHGSVVIPLDAAIPPKVSPLHGRDQPRQLVGTVALDHVAPLQPLV